MDKDILTIKVTKLLGVSQPIKARQLATILTSEFDLQIDRSDVNSVLYTLQTKGITEINDEYQWSLMEALEPEEIDISIDSNIEFTNEQEAIINFISPRYLLSG